VPVVVDDGGGAPMIVRALRGLFSASTLSARAVHAPVALVPGRVPVHVVARGTGLLRVGRERRFVAGAFDDLVFVDVDARAPVVVASFRGQRVSMALVPVAAPAPVVVDVALPAPVVAVAVPDLRPVVPRFTLPLPVLEESE
jgi:hypothetical protein